MTTNGTSDAKSNNPSVVLVHGASHALSVSQADAVAAYIVEDVEAVSAVGAASL